MKINNKKILAIFFIIGIVFFCPAIIQGLLIAHGDGFESYLPIRLFLANNIHNLQLNLWIQNQLLGVPHIGILQSAVFYPLNWLYALIFFIPFPALFNANIIIHYALGAWFMYLLCKHKLKLNTTSSIAAGLMWGFGSFNQAHRGHIAIFNTAIWLPLLIYYVHDLFEKPRLKSAIAIAFILAIQIFAGFIQVFLYSFIVLGIYFLVFFWKSKNKIKILAFGVSALLLTIFIALPQLIQTQEYSSFSYRGRTGTDFLVMLSYQPTYLVSLIIPFVFGGGYHLPLWGYYDQVNHGIYIGLISMIALPFSFLKMRKNKYVIFSLLLLTVSALLMFGKYSPLQMLVEKIPLFGDMRIPSRHRYEFSFALILISAIGLNNIFLNFKKIWAKRLLTSLIIVTGLVIFAIHFFGPQLIDYLNASRSIDRQIIYSKVVFGHNSMAFVMPYIFIVLYLISTILIFIKRPKLFGLTLLVLLTIDLWFFSYKYDTSWPKIEDFKESNKYYASQESLLPNDIYRYWKANDYQDSLMNLVTGSINSGGYDSLMNLDYKNLLNIDGRGKSFNLGSLITNNSLLSMLSIKYIYIDPARALNYNSLKIADKVGSNILDNKNWLSSKSAINGIFSLQSPPRSYDYLIQDVRLDPDTAYIFETDISSIGKQSQYFNLNLDSQGSFNDPLMPNQIFWPEEFINVRQKYFRIFITAPGKKPILTKARIISLSEGTIQVHDAKLYKIGSLNRDFSQYKEVSRNDKEVILENQKVLPRIYSIEFIESYDSMNDFKYISYTKQPDFGKTAYLPKEEFNKIPSKNYSEAQISDENFTNDEISFTSTNDASDSYIVLSDMYYPGWKVTIDDKEATIHKTNGILRGVIVPKGKHTIIYKYVPINFYIALGVSTFATIFSISYLFYLNRKSVSLK